MTKVWRFIPEDHRLSHGDGREMRPGQRLTVEGDPVPCEHGFHGSETLFDALRYLHPDMVLTSSRIAGEIAWGSYKLCGTVLYTDWIATEEETARFIRRWSVWCAGRALRYIPKAKRKPFRDLLRTVAKHIRGQAIDEQLIAAWEAAAKEAAAKDSYFATAGIAVCEAARFDFMCAYWTASDAASATANGARELALQEAYAKHLFSRMFGVI